jgi:tRNA threonylcarbamoyladenosine biosynthesis protein TsaB
VTDSQPLFLALDTSTRVASVALFDGAQVLSETTWLAGREHSTRLLVEVEASLARIGRHSGELTGLVVARGPGSFTGVRVALSVAKGISAGLSIPAWGVSSLQVLATAAGQEHLPVRVAVEAGRGRFATGLYLDGGPVGQASVATIEQLGELIQAPTLLIGEFSESARATLEQHAHARLASRAASLRRAGFLAELGWRLSLAGDPGDPADLDALYVS